LLFEETPTLGIRRSMLQRTTLVRHVEEVETPWGPISMKVRIHQGEARATPEYEDCRRAAKEHQVPLHKVQEGARSAWRAR
jgi:uncharacterized protein (DUF111 family)